MYLKIAVKIPESEKGISEKKIKGTTYIYYEHGRKYYPDKKYTVPQCTSIGKKDNSNPSMMFPNDNYLKFFPDANQFRCKPHGTLSLRIPRRLHQFFLPVSP